MADLNNVKIVQRQIKAFNKFYSRSDSAHKLTLDNIDIIDSLIGSERMTKGGFAKAGEKYLLSFSDSELLAYSADIQRARESIEIAKIDNSIDASIDPASAIWGTYNYLLDKVGVELDSEQVYKIADSLKKGENRTSIGEVINEMNKVIKRKNYGVSDFYTHFKDFSILNE